MAKRVSKKTSRRSANSSDTPTEQGTMDIKDLLRKKSADYSCAEPVTMGAAVPEGKYQVRIDAASIETAKSSGRLQLTYKFVICGGEMSNRVLYNRDGLEDEQSIGYMKGNLQKLGIVPPTDIEELPEAVAELVGTYAEVQVKHKGDWVNVYVQKALDSDEVGDEGAEEIEEIDVPFEATNDSEWGVGQTVQVDFDGDYYTGVIQSIDGDDVTVDFEDGSTEVVAVSDLEAHAGADEEEGEGEEEEGEGEEDSSADGLEITFDDSAITAAQQKKITKLAEEQEYNPDDFEQWIDLLQELGEYVEVTGVFDSPAKLVTAIAGAV